MGSLLRSTKNTRELPGHARFIRSDYPGGMTDDEVAWLRDRGVTTVVDLRSPDELERRPCRLAEEPGFTFYNLPVTGGGSPPTAPEEVAASYFRMLDGRMEEILDVMLNAPGGVFYYCRAGKDRTGVVTAVLLKRLGCDDETIVGDFLKTRDNLIDDLTAYAARHPETDLQTIVPQEENIRKLLAAL